MRFGPLRSSGPCQAQPSVAKATCHGICGCVVWGHLCVCVCGDWKVNTVTRILRNQWPACAHIRLQVYCPNCQPGAGEQVQDQTCAQVIASSPANKPSSPSFLCWDSTSMQADELEQSVLEARRQRTAGAILFHGRVGSEQFEPLTRFLPCHRVTCRMTLALASCGSNDLIVL